MKTKFHFTSFILTIIIGSIVEIGFAWLNGREFASALFPTMALLSGFILTGAIVGLISKGITILEPGIGSIVVSIIVILVVPAMELKSFIPLTNADWVIIMMNAIVFSVVGAWLGEKLQHRIVDTSKSTTPSFEWGWVIAGTLLGLTVSMIIFGFLGFSNINNVLVDLSTGTFASPPLEVYIPFFITLLVTGIIVGWMSPGVTIKESALAGFLTMTIVFDILQLTLFVEVSLGLGYVIGGLVLGFIATLAGGFIGEVIQKARESKK